MDDAIAHAPAHDLTIDITTTGRKTEQPRRLEMWFHNLDDHSTSDGNMIKSVGICAAQGDQKRCRLLTMSQPC